jgi:hypothetical protein
MGKSKKIKKGRGDETWQTWKTNFNMPSGQTLKLWLTSACRDIFYEFAVSRIQQKSDLATSQVATGSPASLKSPSWNEVRINIEINYRLVSSDNPTFTDLRPVDFWSRFVYKTQQAVLHSKASNAPSFNKNDTEEEQLQLMHSFAIFVGKEMNNGRTLRSFCDQHTVEAWKKGMKNIWLSSILCTKAYSKITVGIPIRLRRPPILRLSPPIRLLGP